MAQITGITTQSISRFELGKQVPRDVAVLVSLRNAAIAAGRMDEMELFNQAVREELAPVATPEEIETITGRQSITGVAHIKSATPDPRVWRLMQTARIAAEYFPDAARVMEQAAGVALVVVNEVIAAAPPPNPADDRFYRELERQLDALAAKKAFAALQKESK